MITTSEFETQMFGREFAKHLKPGALVALHGDLGAGKTTFVKGMMGSLADISEREKSNLPLSPICMFTKEILFPFITLISIVSKIPQHLFKWDF